MAEIFVASHLDLSARDSSALLEAIRQAQARFIAETSPREAFSDLLDILLSITESEYGFIGEVFSKNDGTPFLKTHSITNIAWNEDTRALYDKYTADQGMEFHNLNTLFGRVLVTGKPVIANDSASDPRAGGLPPGHPAMRSFMGLPFFFSGNLVGMIGVANHPNGYTQELVDWLTPFLNTCATLIVGYRNSRDRTLAEEALRESREMLKVVLDSIPERVFWKDRDSVYLGCNKHFARDAGLESAQQIVGKNDFELSWCRQAELYQADDQQVIHSGVPKLNFEETQTRPDGTRLWLKTSKVPLKDPGGNVFGVIGVYEDITEQKWAETELARYREHLEELVGERTRKLQKAQGELVRKERLATLGQLTATVSHELRNPLGAMRPSLYIIEKNSDSNDARVQQAIERIDRNIDRCDRIIDELLDFTRITELHLNATRIDEWLELLIDEQLIPADIHVEKNLSLKDVELPIDRDRLRRAVINVVENACHAMLEHEQSLKARKGSRLDIATGSREGRVEIVISDSGPGIPEELREKIFEPLFSTKSFGVGLGMPAVKQIMQQHGGGIEIDTAAGHGTRITLWLPGNTADRDDEEVAA